MMDNPLLDWNASSIKTHDKWFDAMVTALEKGAREDEVRGLVLMGLKIAKSDGSGEHFSDTVRYYLSLAHGHNRQYQFWREDEEMGVIDSSGFKRNAIAQEAFVVLGTHFFGQAFRNQRWFDGSHKPNWYRWLIEDELLQDCLDFFAPVYEGKVVDRSIPNLPETNGSYSGNKKAAEQAHSFLNALLSTAWCGPVRKGMTSRESSEPIDCGTDQFNAVRPQLIRIMVTLGRSHDFRTSDFPLDKDGLNVLRAEAQSWGLKRALGGIDMDFLAAKGCGAAEAVLLLENTAKNRDRPPQSAKLHII